MTTSVTDERKGFEKWAESQRYSITKLGTLEDPSYASDTVRIAWIAWQAALRSQGKVVSVEKLKALQPYFIDWRYEELEPCEWGSAGTTVVKIDDLTAIIGEGD